MTEGASNRLSEPKRSSSSANGNTLVLRLLLPESFFAVSVDTGNVSTEGLGEISASEGGEDEEVGKAVGADELGRVGLACFWLDLSGKPEPDGLGFGAGTSPLLVASSSPTDLWAACCLAVLDWGLR